MNPGSLGEAKRIAGKTRLAAVGLERAETVVCPPFPFIPAAFSRKASANYAVGAQSVSFDDGGAHTGEVAAGMLKSLGVEYVIAGHSEVRAAGDTDEAVSRRVSRVIEAGMTAVVCVGEKTRDEEGGHFNFVRDQIKASLAGVSSGKGPFAGRKAIIAYEPVWAIGAREPMAAVDIREMAILVRKALADMFGVEAASKVRVLYGGAVNFRNAAEIMIVGQVDGLLVGRESINIPGFIELLRAVDGA